LSPIVKSVCKLIEHIGREGLVVIDFSATWCGPCRAIAPKFSEFSNKYSNVTFVHVDVDEVSNHPEVQKVSGVPHFKFYKNGSFVTEFSGANASTLQTTIEQNC